MKTLLKTVLKEIKPTPEEVKKVQKRIAQVITRIQKAIPEAKTILGGSGEKNTWLKNAHDADIFVMFPPSFVDKDISTIVEKKLKNTYVLERLHGSRDYFQTEVEKDTFEIVPIIQIKKAEEARNITDVSPLHAKWVKKHAKWNDDIRLLKQFFRGAKIYGAESYINGFSGYICEVLTIHYGGFEKAIRAIAKWKKQTILDPQGAYKGKKLLLEMDKAKTQGPLIIVDPVQASRNAAAAVSEEQFQKAIAHAKAFLKSPTAKFFSPQPLTKESFQKKNRPHSVFVYTIHPLKGKRDIIGCKLVKAFEYLLKRIEEEGFTLITSEWDWEEHAIFAFAIKKETLSADKIISGPPEKMQTFAKDFKKKHKKVFSQKGMLFAKESRTFRSCEPFLKKVLQEQYVKERIQRITPL